MFDISDFTVYDFLSNLIGFPDAALDSRYVVTAISLCSVILVCAITFMILQFLLVLFRGVGRGK